MSLESDRELVTKSWRISGENGISLFISEEPDLLSITLNISDTTVTLSKAAWKALMRIDYEIRVNNPMDVE